MDLERIKAGFDYIFNLINNLQQTVDVGMFRGTGLVLLTAILLLMIAYTGIRAVLENAPAAEVVSNIAVLIFTWGMVSWVISSTEFLDGVLNGFSSLGGKMLTLSGSAVESSSDLRGALGKLVNTALTLIYPNADREVEMTDPKTYVGPMLTFVFRFFMALLVALMTLVYMGIYVITQVLVLFAILLGPLLAPFFMIRPLSFIATGWFRFLIVACMQKLAGIFVLAVTADVINRAAVWAQQTDPGIGAQFGLFAGLFLLIGSMAYLMMQAMSMGSGIVSGMPFVAAAVPSKLTPAGTMTAGGQSVSKAGGAGARATGRGLKAAGTNLLNRWRGGSAKSGGSATAASGGNQKGNGKG